MKTGKIFWGVGFILLAVIFILDALGVMTPLASTIGDISLLSVLIALFLLSYTVVRLTKGKIAEIFVPLAFIFMLFEKNVATICGLEDSNIINNWLLFGCGILLWIGFTILFSGAKKRSIEIKTHGGNKSSSNISSSVKYIDASSFKEEWVENNLGGLSVYFENADKYEGGATLYVENSLGATVINVPSGWRYDETIENSLGCINFTNGKGGPNGPLLIIKGENNLGSISIKLV